MSKQIDKIWKYYALGLLVMTYVFGVAPQTAAAMQLRGATVAEVGEYILESTNTARASANVPALVYNDTLAAIAQEKAWQLASRGEFAHITSAGAVWQLFSKFQYHYRHAGENLALHFTQGDKLMAAWLASPSHRENLLAARYTEMGVGVAVGTFDGHRSLVVVHIFAAPTPVVTW